MFGTNLIEEIRKPHEFAVHRPAPRQTQVVSSKQLTMIPDTLTLPAKSPKKRKPYIPPPEHPRPHFHIRPATAQSNPTR